MEDVRFPPGEANRMRRRMSAWGISSSLCGKARSPKSRRTRQVSPVFLQTENGMVSCFKREGNIIKKGNKKDKISYYVGWGIAYGTFAGGIFSVLLPEYLLVVLCLGIAIGAVVGVILGKRKLSM